MFARRNSIFVTGGFSLGPCLLLSDVSLLLLWTFSALALLISQKIGSGLITGLDCLI